MTPAMGDIKRTKRSGPRTEPWGTPVHIVVLGEDDESNVEGVDDVETDCTWHIAVYLRVRPPPTVIAFVMAISLGPKHLAIQFAY